MLRNHGNPDEVRLDCADPSRCYVKFKLKWICAVTSDVLTQQVSSKQDKIFARLYTRDSARANRALKEAARDGVIDQVDLANASKPATRNVQPGAHDVDSSTLPAPHEAPMVPSSPWTFEESETSAFDEVSNA